MPPRRARPALLAVLVVPALLAGCARIAQVLPAGMPAAVRNLPAALPDALPMPRGAGTAPTRVRVAGGDVTVGGMAGFCVDRTSLGDSADGAFVRLVGCGAVWSRPGAPSPLVVADLTADIGEPATGTFDPAEMEPFVRSEAGRAFLAQSGQPGDVQVLDTARTGQVVLVQASDATVAGGAAHWRALMLLSGRVVTLAVLPLPGQPLADDLARALLERFVARMLALN